MGKLIGLHIMHFIGNTCLLWVSYIISRLDVCFSKPGVLDTTACCVTWHDEMRPPCYLRLLPLICVLCITGCSIPFALGCRKQENEVDNTSLLWLPIMDSLRICPTFSSSFFLPFSFFFAFVLFLLPFSSFPSSSFLSSYSSGSSPSFLLLTRILFWFLMH